MDEAEIVRGPRKERGFTIIDNSLLNDKAMSFRARGVLAYLLSKPTGWKVSAERLSSEAKEGRDAMRTALNEIEAAGYLVRRRWRDPVSKQWRSTQTIYDEPQREVSEGSDQAKQQVGPTADFQRQLPSDSYPGALVRTGKELGKGGTSRSRITAVPSPAPPSPPSPRCSKHAALPADADVPPCRPCKVARERYEAERPPKPTIDRAAIDECPMCDDNGLVEVADHTVERCKHTHRRSSA
ncbi:helix-turn-helix DNA binding domain protein [Gordonia phage Clawz]|uniref:Helix-turn-helix DNA binding domain protein n=1 Tax=Gordonia phage Clawz TaxID=2743910 RepID=A0AAE7K799_9CAUD|nr:helix-turn-helix DNA binding domain protein [Gordonia phage Clawz]QKY79987.1 helix-turn-helix DNA binding domain protein [Gordonia phage Clawz]